MISALVLISALFTPVPCATPLAAPATAQGDAAYEERLTGAGDDPVKLWDLVIWCESTERDKKARIVLRRLVKLEPRHRRAHEKLGHVEHEGKWFLTRKKLEDHIAAEEKRKVKASGLVRYKGEWRWCINQNGAATPPTPTMSARDRDRSRPTKLEHPVQDVAGEPRLDRLSI